MSFNIWPAFSFNLNRIIVGSVKFGKYDGIHVCLTAVTSTDKVISFEFCTNIFNFLISSVHIEIH